MNKKCKVISFSVDKDIRKDYAKLLREILSVQSIDGGWNYNDYNRGVYNGLECALALLEEREPSFRSSIEVSDYGDHCIVFDYAKSLFLVKK